MAASGRTLQNANRRVEQSAQFVGTVARVSGLPATRIAPRAQTMPMSPGLLLAPVTRRFTEGCQHRRRIELIYLTPTQIFRFRNAQARVDL
jgi:hypothetical protein